MGNYWLAVNRRREKYKKIRASVRVLIQNIRLADLLGLPVAPELRDDAEKINTGSFWGDNNLTLYGLPVVYRERPEMIDISCAENSAITLKVPECNGHPE